MKLLQDHMLSLNSVGLPPCPKVFHILCGILYFCVTYLVLREFDFLLLLCLKDTFIQKTKKLYQDTRTQRNISKLNDELYEVHQIMTRNVQEVLGVGEKLDRKLFLFVSKRKVLCLTISDKIIPKFQFCRGQSNVQSFNIRDSCIC